MMNSTPSSPLASPGSLHFTWKSSVEERNSTVNLKPIQFKLFLVFDLFRTGLRIKVFHCLVKIKKLKSVMVLKILDYSPSLL